MTSGVVAASKLSGTRQGRAETLLQEGTLLYHRYMRSDATVTLSCEHVGRDVVVVSWPDQAEERDRLDLAGVPRLWLVDALPLLRSPRAASKTGSGSPLTTPTFVRASHRSRITPRITRRAPSSTSTGCSRIAVWSFACLRSSSASPGR